jgi:hypothetical protein
MSHLDFLVAVVDEDIDRWLVRAKLRADAGGILGTSLGCLYALHFRYALEFQRKVRIHGPVPDESGRLVKSTFPISAQRRFRQSEATVLN